MDEGERACAIPNHKQFLGASESETSEASRNLKKKNIIYDLGYLLGFSERRLCVRERERGNYCRCVSKENRGGSTFRRDQCAGRACRRLLV